MKRKMFAISLAVLLLLAGCGGGGTVSGGEMANRPASSAPQYTDTENNYWGMDAVEGDFAPAPEPEAPSVPGASENQGSSVYQNPGAKLIRRAELTIQTERFDESRTALNRLVDDCGGYFETASEYGGSWRDVNASRRGEYTVRVPAEHYDRFLSGTGDLGYVTNRSENSEDVGEEYFDIEARLKTQRTKQERLLALLEKAETMEDIIALESALSDVEYQIEMYSSDLRRYDALVSFSTFNVYLSEVDRVTEEVGEFRMSSLVQWGYVAGYITYPEALALLEPAATLLCENFSSWEEAYENYLEGYNWWARNDVLDKDIWETNRGASYRMIAADKNYNILDDTLFETGVIPVPGVTAQQLLQSVLED